MSQRIVLMSDIHGNLPALEAVAGAIPRTDQVCVAGDLVFDGPCPAEVLDLLRELGWTLIMGNTDRDITAPPGDGTKKRSRRVEWTRTVLGDDRLTFLQELPFSARFSGADGDTVLAVHANPIDMDRHLRPSMTEDELAPFLEGIDASILAFGHLHTPYIRPANGVVLIDVSSVGHPKDGDRRAAYTVVTWEAGGRSVEQVRVPYDLDNTIHLLRHSGLPDAEEQVASLLKASY